MLVTYPAERGPEPFGADQEPTRSTQFVEAFRVKAVGQNVLQAGVAVGEEPVQAVATLQGVLGGVVRHRRAGAGAPPVLGI